MKRKTLNQQPSQRCFEQRYLTKTWETETNKSSSRS